MGVTTGVNEEGSSESGGERHGYEYVNEAGSWTGRSAGETVDLGLRDPGFMVPGKESMVVSLGL